VAALERHDEQPTVVVTGGTGGIGRAVAQALAERGYRVLIVGRSDANGSDVVATLERTAPGRRHRFVRADLSLLGDTAQAADQILDCTDRVDALVLCAGVLSRVAEPTSEQLERTFVLNYLSRYLLIRRLLPQLKQAVSGRVVLVANAGKYRDTLDMNDLQLRNGGRGLWISGRTQFANDLLAVDLSERLSSTRVEVTCVYPGLVATEVFGNARGLPRAMRVAAGFVQRLVGSTPEVAAQMPLFLAGDAAAVGAGGKFFGPGLRPLRIPGRAQRPDRRAALWAASDELVRPWLAEQARQFER